MINMITYIDFFILYTIFWKIKMILSFLNEMLYFLCHMKDKFIYIINISYLKNKRWKKYSRFVYTIAFKNFLLYIVLYI